MTSIRTELRPGDIGAITRLHGVVYAAEYGWDWTFEAYVALTLGEMAARFDVRRDRIWLGEHGDVVVACIGILGTEAGVGQLRWFLVHPSARGSGLGRRLMDVALAFCRAAGHTHVFLWTVSDLTAAAHLYRSVGFERTHQEQREQWGAVLTYERYDLQLR